MTFLSTDIPKLQLEGDKPLKSKDKDNEALRKSILELLSKINQLGTQYDKQLQGKSVSSSASTGTIPLQGSDATFSALTATGVLTATGGVSMSGNGAFIMRNLGSVSGYALTAKVGETYLLWGTYSAVAITAVNAGTYRWAENGSSGTTASGITTAAAGGTILTPTAQALIVWITRVA